MLTTKTKLIILAAALLLIVGGFTATVIRVLTAPNIGLTLDRQLLNLEVGNTAVLSIKDIDPDKLQWSSSDINIARVNKQGKVTAVGPGSAAITVKAGGKTATCNVFVSPDLQIIPDTVWVGIWETKQLQLSGDDSEWIMWTSANNDIAQVDGQGIITGYAIGTTTIKAETNKKTALCDVTVYGVSPDSISLQAGEKQQVQFKPAADGETVTWTSKDTNIAVVDQSGNITAVAVGKTEVTASAEGKKLSAQSRSSLPALASKKYLSCHADGSWSRR